MPLKGFETKRNIHNVNWSGTLFACPMTKTKDVKWVGMVSLTPKLVQKKKKKTLASMLVLYRFLKSKTFFSIGSLKYIPSKIV